MRFKGLDLNLLVALDILLTEKNVSRAADRLCLSQSATSGALARLRDYFGDELLTQVGRQMMLTPRAIELADKVRAALVQIDGTILRSPEFDPATADRQIAIIASDYATIAALRAPLRRISGLAPNLRIEIHNPGSNPLGQLERGEVDLLLMPELYLSPHHPKAQLFDDDYVIVVSNQNTWAGDTMTVDEFFAAEHVTARFPTFTPTYETWFLKNRPENRRLACQAESFLALPFLVQGTDRVGLMHRRLAESFVESLDLRLIAPPFEIPPLTEFLQWNTFNDGDVCIGWVRDQIVAAHNPSV